MKGNGRASVRFSSSSLFRVVGKFGKARTRILTNYCKLNLIEKEGKGKGTPHPNKRADAWFVSIH